MTELKSLKAGEKFRFSDHPAVWVVVGEESVVGAVKVMQDTGHPLEAVNTVRGDEMVEVVEEEGGGTARPTRDDAERANADEAIARLRCKKGSGNGLPGGLYLHNPERYGSEEARQVMLRGYPYGEV